MNPFYAEFDYKIRLEYNHNEFALRQILDWCEQNAGLEAEAWSWGWHIVQQRITNVDFYFSDAHMATMFTLRWGQC